MRRACLNEVRKRFFPLLRAEGFTGSGSTVRRVTAPLIHVVNIQGCHDGEGCYVNLGAHLAFLDPGVPLDHLGEFHCLFRTRFDPPGADAGQAWRYGRAPDDDEQTTATMGRLWPAASAAFFDRFRHYPQDFITLLRQDPIPGATGCALGYARIAQHLGLREEGRKWALVGLAQGRPGATNLRADLQQILVALGDQPG